MRAALWFRRSCGVTKSRFFFAESHVQAWLHQTDTDATLRFPSIGAVDWRAQVTQVVEVEACACCHLRPCESKCGRAMLVRMPSSQFCQVFFEILPFF
ncbi:hypothetical protein DBA29_12655 [Xenophilus aerolatus]|nr:hypothetical protein [Xenophilus aerolatus]